MLIPRLSVRFSWCCRLHASGDGGTARWLNPARQLPDRTDLHRRRVHNLRPALCHPLIQIVTSPRPVVGYAVAVSFDALDASSVAARRVLVAN